MPAPETRLEKVERLIGQARRRRERAARTTAVMSVVTVLAMAVAAAVAVQWLSGFLIAPELIVLSICIFTLAILRGVLRLLFFG